MPPHDPISNGGGENRPPKRPAGSPILGWRAAGQFWIPIGEGDFFEVEGGPAPVVVEERPATDEQAEQAESHAGRPRPSLHAVPHGGGDGAQIISNFFEDGTGERTPRPIRAIATDLTVMLHGWPRRIGGRLFMPGTDRPDEGGVRWLDSPDALFGAVVGREVDQLRWVTGVDAQGTSFWTQKQLFEYLRFHAEHYESASMFPMWPIRPEIWTPWNDALSSAPDSILPSRDEAAALVEELLAWFLPATPEIDMALICALFLSQFWGGPGGEQPLLIVHGEQGEHGQESGKSTLVNLLARVTGGAFALSVTPGADSPLKQLVSDVAIGKRVVLIDNMPERARDTSELESAITSPSLQGRASFGVQAMLPNQRTYAATTNYIRFRADLIKRSLIMRIKKPVFDPTWKPRVRAWVDENRRALQLAAIAILRHGPVVELPPEMQSRFPEWGHAVLACHPDAPNALARYHEDVATSDIEVDDAEIFAAHVWAVHSDRTTLYGLEPVEPAKLADWYNGAGISPRRLGAATATRRVKRLAEAGRIPWLMHDGSGAGWLLDLTMLGSVLGSGQTDVDVNGEDFI